MMGDSLRRESRVVNECRAWMFHVQRLLTVDRWWMNMMARKTGRVTVMTIVGLFSSSKVDNLAIELLDPIIAGRWLREPGTELPLEDHVHRDGLLALACDFLP